MTAHDAFVALAAIGGLLLVLGMLSGLIHEKGILSEPLFALLAGVLIGPAAFGFVDLAHFGDPQTILEYAALVTITVALVGVALRLPGWYSLRNGRLLLVLLGCLMPLMWVTCSLLAYLILGLPFWVCVLLGAILTPTDPVVASTIVTGGVAERNLPARLRNAISAESGWRRRACAPLRPATRPHPVGAAGGSNLVLAYAHGAPGGRRRRGAGRPDRQPRRLVAQAGGCQGDPGEDPHPDR